MLFYTPISHAGVQNKVYGAFIRGERDLEGLVLVPPWALMPLVSIISCPPSPGSSAWPLRMDTWTPLELLNSCEYIDDENII